MVSFQFPRLRSEVKRPCTVTLLCIARSSTAVTGGPDGNKRFNCFRLVKILKFISPFFSTAPDMASVGGGENRRSRLFCLLEESPLPRSKQNKQCKLYRAPFVCLCVFSNMFMFFWSFRTQKMTYLIWNGRRSGCGSLRPALWRSSWRVWPPILASWNRLT